MKTEFLLITAGLLLAAAGVGLGQPVITQQPQSCTNAPGTTATFTVEATGTPPLAYQWLSGSSLATATNLPAETNATLVLTNVQLTRRYAVAVSDMTGSVTSVLARLQVLLPPAIATSGQPTNFPCW